MVKNPKFASSNQLELGCENGGLGDERERKKFRIKNPEPVIWKWFPVDNKSGVITYYSGWYDCYRTVSPLLEGFVEGRVAHTGYLAGHGRGGSIELILIKNDKLQGLKNRIDGASYYINIVDSRDLVSRYRMSDNVAQHARISLVDILYGIKTEILAKHKDLEKALLEIIRADVVDHCKKPYNREMWGEKFKDWAGVHIVDEIVPKTEAHVIKLGPNSMIIRRGKGQHEDHTICPVKIATEFGRGCLSNTMPDGTYYPDGRCGYCYGKAKNSPFFLKNVYDADVNFIVDALREKREEKWNGKSIAREEGENGKGKKVLVKGRRTLWRLGITTDPFIPKEVRDKWSLPYMLKNCLKAVGILNGEGYDIVPLIFTKYPGYEKGLAKLLIESNMRLFASIGKDCLETGAVALGFDTERRIKEVVKYKKAGVNAGITLVTDLTRPFEGRKDIDPSDPLDRVLEIADKNDLNLMLIALRNKLPNVMEKFTLRTKDGLKRTYGQNPLIGVEGHEGWMGYRPRSKTNVAELVIEGIHPEIKKLVKGSNHKIGLCSSPGGEEACCGCFAFEKPYQKIIKG